MTTEAKKKSKYNALQNSVYMIRLAWQAKEKKVLLFCLLSAMFAVAKSLLELFVTPALLRAVETREPIAQLLWTILFFAGGLMICAAATAYIDSNKMYGKISVRKTLIGKICKKGTTTSYPNVDDKTFMDLSSRSSNAVGGNQQASEAIWNTLTDLLKNTAGFVLYLVMMTALPVGLTLLIVVSAVVGYYVSKYLNGYEYRHREEFGAYDRELWYLDDCAKDSKAAKDIRIFGLRPWFSELRQHVMTALIALRRKKETYVFWAAVLNLVLTFVRHGAAYWYLITAVLQENLPVSDFLLYFSAVGGLTGWIVGILENAVTLHRQSLEISTIREMLEFPEPFLFDGGASVEVDPNGVYEIRLEDVSFRYPKTESDILSHINLTLHPGEKLAIVGLNGAGKTTLVKLMCGFLDPTAGRVLLNGVDIRTYNRREYYRLFSAVFQDFSLLASTVAANVAQTEDEIDLDRVKACVEQAGLREKVESLPNGYETYLNREVYEDAVMLSGGETQRLMLARALYKNAPFVMLDEPTAALDPIAEAEMYGKYREMTVGRSSVYISHRLASTRFCDRILLIGDGQILEAGSHEDLLARKGRYAELFEVQRKYYREGDVADERE